MHIKYIYTHVIHYAYESFGADTIYKDSQHHSVGNLIQVGL